MTFLTGSPIRAADQTAETLVLTNSTSDSVTYLDPATSEQETVTVGAAPWGITRCR